MTDLMQQSPHRFAPVHVDPSELDEAITEAVVQLRTYNEWRHSQGLAPSTGESIFWCFVAASAPTDALRAVVLRWLDDMAGAPLAN